MADGRRRDRMFGWVLAVMGVLIALLSGLCSAAMLGEPGGAGLQMAPLVAIFGGIPFMLGGGMVIAGLAMVRNASKL